MSAESAARYRSVFAPGLFAGRVIVITGGGSGIGRCTAHELASLGATVVLVGRNPDKLQTTLAEIEADGGRAGVQVCDIRQEETVRAMVTAVLAAHGRIDGLVNNAGGQYMTPLEKISAKGWQAVIDTNLTGGFLVARECYVQGMQARGGAVVNIASISGLRASTMRVAYGTSKGALIHLTKQQAIELGDAGIRVNCVAPGPVDTEMAKLVHTVAIRSDYHDTIPLNRYGTTEEIAEAVGFLCSPAASYVNGQTLAVDGGFDASGVGLPTLRRTGGKV